MLKSSRLFVLCRTRTCRFSTGKIIYRSRKTHSSFESKELQTGTSRITTNQPGIGSRLKIIKEDQPDIEDMELDEGDLEDMEEDFLNAKEMLNKHKREMEKKNFNIGLKITERKYFKQPVEPNLLTWSEKEQIRNLHSEDRLVWTVEKLAESFPATPDIIAKVLKASWKPPNAAKVRKHDETVAENWRKLYAGELTIHNLNLREHLKKFNRRNLLPNTTDYSSYAERLLPEPKTSEFSSIIESYKQLKLESDSIASGDCDQPVKKRLDSGEMEEEVTLKENVHLNKKIHSQRHTLDTLRMDVVRDMAMKGRQSEDDGQFIKKYVDEVNARHVYEEVEDGKVWGKEDGGSKKSCKESKMGKIGEKSEESCVGVADENRSVYGDDSYNRIVGRKLLNNERNEENGFSPKKDEEIDDKKLWSVGKEPKISQNPGNSAMNYSFDEEESVLQQNEDKVIDTKLWNEHIARVDKDDGGFQHSSNNNHNYVDLGRNTMGAADAVGKNDTNHKNNGEIIVDVGSPVSIESRNRKTAVTGVVGGGNFGSRSNSFESEFNADCKYPPARYNREGSIIWRPERKHAVADDIPYRIRIPRDKVKKGYLYKVKDCFYTHEGELLYRVPGMS